MNDLKCVGKTKAGKRCNHYKLDGHDHCKRCMEGKASNFESRRTTDHYEYMKDWQINKTRDLPYYTNQDEIMKQLIWGYENGCCFDTREPLSLTGKNTRKKGDHIWGLRERARENKIGWDSLWNIIPCTHNVNIKWKTQNVPGKKNLVYDTFTEEEIKKFPKKVLKRYNKLIKWRKYCISRGVNKLYIEIPEGMNEKVAEIISKGKKDTYNKLNEFFLN
tara:strand:+ start:977 stop:1633 length:657 start_codon:yes stop_codon:yes gene_type:complete